MLIYCRHLRLRLLQQQLERGQVPNLVELRRTVELAAEALSSNTDGEDTIKR